MKAQKNKKTKKNSPIDERALKTMLKKGAKVLFGPISTGIKKVLKNSYVFAIYLRPAHCSWPKL